MIGRVTTTFCIATFRLSVVLRVDVFETRFRVPARLVLLIDAPDLDLPLLDNHDATLETPQPTRAERAMSDAEVWCDPEEQPASVPLGLVHAADPDDDSLEAIAARTDFGDLEAQDGVCEIGDTAKRSMALTQLIKICQHLERRSSPGWSCFGTTIEGERWVVGRMEEGGGFKNDHLTTSWDEVNLFSLDSFYFSSMNFLKLMASGWCRL